jgi:hypothetical protein
MQRRETCMVGQLNQPAVGWWHHPQQQGIGFNAVC